MSMEFGKGIGVSSGFDLGTKGPLDSRITVATIADRDAHSTKNRAYEGMLVYVEADKTLYQFVDNSWKPLLKDLKDKLDSIENQLGLGGATGEGSINDRINALEAKDTELYNKINSEEQARTNADNDIENSINGEINRAKSTEEKLQSDIDNEITTRIQNISDLQDQISNINLNIGETGDLGAQVKANKEAIEIINGEDIQNGSIAKALKDAKTYADTELAKKADKEHGTHLTLGTGSGNAYRGDYGNIAYTHSQTAHAPSNAQKNSDITKTEIEAKLTGNITSHTHNQYLTQHQDISGKADVSDLTSHTENTSIHIIADERRTWNNKAEKTVATIDSDGLMGADMVTKLNNIADGANNYKHPSTHAATMIIEDTTHRFVTDTDKSNWNNKVSTSSSVTTNHIAVFNDTTGKVIKDGGFTIATSVPANAKFTDTTYTADAGIQLNGTTFQHTNSVTAGTAQGDANKTLTFGGTFTIPTVTYDAQGHITGKSTTTMTMPATPTSVSGNAGSASKVNNSIKVQLNGGTTEGTNQFTFDGSAAKNINITPSSIGAATTSTATTSANGLMSSTDKSKLDGIATNANNYSHPTYTSKTSGLYKVTVDGTGHVSATTAVTKADITSLGIPGSDTTYSVATTSANGLMSSTDKSKLDGIAAGANKTTVDSSISDTSTNPIQNKVIKSYVDTKVADIVDSAPETLNTLKELSTALGNDPNFATTIATEIGTKANASDLTAHIEDAIHITAAERTAWNAKSNLALGTTSATAFRGDYGNIAYTHSQTAHAPSDAQKNADITKAEIEEKLTGNITTHTHNYAGSSSVGGAATSANKVNANLVVKLNNGSTEGANLFTFNGSAAKNINITPSSIGAATTSVVTTKANGLMSSTDKSKLDGIATNANNYSHPTYTSKTSGLYKVAVDGTGHVSAATAVTKADITSLGIPGSDTTYSVATTDANGLMSSTDKSKLDGIATNANNYSHPTYTSKTSGLYKVAVDGTGHVSATTAVTKADITSLGIPGSDTTYSVATTSANGLMSSTDKSKLDGIAANANNYSHPTTSGNKHIPSGGSSGQILRWSADGTAVWGNDNNTTYSANTGIKLNGTTFQHTNSVTAGTAQGDANKTLTFGGTFTIPTVTYDAQGHITGKGTTTMTMPATPTSVSGNAGSASKVNNSIKIQLNGGTTEGTNQFTFNGSAAKNINITPSSIGAATTSVVTTSANGLMSSTDKSKLDGIATNANNYSHPTYTSKTSGLYKVAVDGTGHVSATTAVTKADITSLGIPGSDTTYSVATTSANGLMSSTDKSKLDGIATNANNYSHPTTSGNKHIPSGGSSGQILRWSADGTATWGADNNTATAASNILSGSNSGTQITYAPYTAQQAKLSFDTSTTNPTRTDRLNLNGNLHATNIASNTVKINGKVNMVYNSTTESLDFVFE